MIVNYSDYYNSVEVTTHSIVYSSKILYAFYIYTTTES